MSLSRTPAGQVTHQIVNVEYDGDDNPIFVGYAEPGTADDEDHWLIQQLTWVAGNMTTLRFAEGKADYAFTWDSRAGYSYA